MVDIYRVLLCSEQETIVNHQKKQKDAYDVCFIMDLNWYKNITEKKNKREEVARIHEILMEIYLTQIYVAKKPKGIGPRRLIPREY